MGNYLARQDFTLGKYTLAVDPYIAVPENVFATGAAIQYGADFKVGFSRSAPQQNRIGLLQLIFPQTKLFDATVVGQWNVDKRAPDVGFGLTRCLYGNDISTIGTHSAYYSGQNVRSMTPTQCWLIDTPREIMAKFENGRFTGTTNTKFANYVVDLTTGKVFDQGFVWGYSVVQDPKKLTSFSMNIVPPVASTLSGSNEHLQAIGTFLNLTRTQVKNLIAA